jgi:hypothetical protein
MNCLVKDKIVNVVLDAIDIYLLESEQRYFPKFALKLR